MADTTAPVTDATIFTGRTALHSAPRLATYMASKLGTASGSPSADFAAALYTIDKKVHVSNYASAGTDRQVLQAAIDDAIAKQAQAVIMPAGVFQTDGPVFLDPPNNLRASLAQPTQFGFSLALIGAGGLGNMNQHGTWLRPATNDFTALWVGPGQGMAVRSLSIWPASKGNGWSRKSYSPNGVGIGIAGGPAGASRTLISECGVHGFHRGIVTGLNADALADSTTIFKTLVDGCYTGIEYHQTQNYINGLIDTNVNFCNTAVYSPVGKSVTVTGGNYSCPGAQYKKFVIAGISALERYDYQLPGGSMDNYRFTATVSDPDPFMLEGAYDAACVNLPGFGLVPCRLDAFDVASGTASLSFWPMWTKFHYGWQSNLLTQTNIEAALQATQTLYACEWAKTFYGTGWNISGVHIENPTALTTLLYAEAGFNGDNVAKIDRVFFNASPSKDEFRDQTNDLQALFYCQAAFPFLFLGNDLTLISNWNTGQHELTEPVVIDVAKNLSRLVVEKSDLFSPRIRYNPNSPLIRGYYGEAQTPAFGAGDWDVTPFLPRQAQTRGVWRLKSYGYGRSPMVGYRPAPWSTPAIEAADIARLAADPVNLNDIPLLHADTLYQVFDESGAAMSFSHVRRVGRGFSYGTDLPIEWSYEGQAPVVTMSDTSRMFPGLIIILNDGVADRSYYVTGVLPALGQVTVCEAGGASNVTLGTKGTIYSGSLVKQEPIRLTKFGPVAA